MTVDIARPRSRYGNASPIVALVFGKIIAAPMPATVRSAMSTRKLVANAEMSVKRPMQSEPATRKRLRPPRSENGPTMSETRMPGAPYAATSSPAVPVLMSNSRAICVMTGATTTVAYTEAKVRKPRTPRKTRRSRTPTYASGRSANAWMNRPNARM
jgi:hypothetical protein